MFEKPKFFGSTTVGERGQMVLPSELRKNYQIKAGDKLIVLGLPGIGENDIRGILLLKAEVLNRILAMAEQQENAIREILREDKDAKSK
jgi:AbrB family looped-hinge helix DNA binding protein